MPKSCSGTWTICCRPGRRSPRGPEQARPVPDLPGIAPSIIRALRDYLRADIGEILVDTDELYADAREFMQQVMPQSLRKLKQYKDDIPLFNRFQIDRRSRTRMSAMSACPRAARSWSTRPKRWPPSPSTPPRATKGSDIEETAFQTNLEAAEEVARQLRLRDPRRPGGHRLHRHGLDQAPTRSREPPAERPQVRPRARPAGPHLALRPDGDEPPAPAPEPGRNRARSCARVATAMAACAAWNRCRCRSSASPKSTR